MKLATKLFQWTREPAAFATDADKHQRTIPHKPPACGVFCPKNFHESSLGDNITERIARLRYTIIK